MKTKTFKKLPALLIALLMILSLILPVFADDYPTEEIDETVEWVYDESTGELTHGDAVYTEYFLSSGFWIIAESRYEYYDSIPMEVYETRKQFVMHILPDEEVPVVRTDIAFVAPNGYAYESQTRLFVTPAGKKVLDAFEEGQYATYQIAKYEAARADIPQGYWADLEGREPNLMLDAKTLRNATSYDILGVDATGNFAHIIGAVYRTLDGHGYVYVHYDALESNMLNADGTLSFRGGQVPAYTLDTATIDKLISYAENSNTPTDQVFTKNSFEQDDLDIDQTPALILFALMLSPFLYVAPLLFLVLGIVMCSIKKIPGRKRWGGLVAVSCLWLACSVAITVLCIVAMVI